MRCVVTYQLLYKAQRIMAIETNEELDFKIEKLEERIKELKDAEYPNEGQIYVLELEAAKFKNMRSDSKDVVTQREIEAPKSVTLNGIKDQELREKNPEWVARQNDPVDHKADLTADNVTNKNTNTNTNTKTEPTRAAPLKEDSKKD